MADADVPTVNVGVRLDAEPTTLGEWLADAVAYDAAGADALWLDLAPTVELDAVAVAAALAVMSARSRIVLVLDSLQPSPDVARGLGTVRRLSRDRLTLAVDADRVDELPQRVGDIPLLGREPDGTGWVDRHAEAGDLARWMAVPPPDGRAVWRDMLAQAAARGLRGVVVDSAPTLLDVLRRPEEPSGRRDLRLAQG
jgi:hypothetical protein